MTIRRNKIHRHPITMLMLPIGPKTPIQQSVHKLCCKLSPTKPPLPPVSHQQAIEQRTAEFTFAQSIHRLARRYPNFGRGRDPFRQQLSFLLQRSFVPAFLRPSICAPGRVSAIAKSSRCFFPAAYSCLVLFPRQTRQFHNANDSLLKWNCSQIWSSDGSRPPARPIGGHLRRGW